MSGKAAYSIEGATFENCNHWF